MTPNEEYEIYMKHLNSLTNQEIKELLIKAGIYDSDMNLTATYRRGEDDGE